MTDRLLVSLDPLQTQEPHYDGTRGDREAEGPDDRYTGGECGWLEAGEDGGRPGPSLGSAFFIRPCYGHV